MKNKNIILLYGGGGSEHSVSAISVKYLYENILKLKLNPILVEAVSPFDWISENKKVTLESAQSIKIENTTLEFACLIPCIHGTPGEDGKLLAYLELMQVPFMGNLSEASQICFNKISTKLWAEKLNVPTLPFIILSSINDLKLEDNKSFLEQNKSVFIKASNQGSSVGCYPCKDQSELTKLISEAFKFSHFVLIEPLVKPRELEVSTFEYQGKIHSTLPGEILPPDSDFYSYEEKYSNASHTKVELLAKDISTENLALIQQYSQKLFAGLKLRHLARIDFFMIDNQVYLNEINTMPGMTSISMFPKMLENYGPLFDEYLQDTIQNI